ncbi:MAG: hypothetical protein WBH03_18715 [Cyclobacteriaceae bacterium]
MGKPKKPPQNLQVRRSLRIKNKEWEYEEEYEQYAPPDHTIKLLKSLFFLLL